MKKITLILGAFLTLFMVSCEVNSVDGRDGLNGFDGEDGLDAPLPKILEFTDTFDASNEFGFRYTFESNIEVLTSDVVLVYILWDVVDADDGGTIDVWRLLPQTRILDQGLLQYNYEHTFVDVDIFLEADFDLATLPTADTEDQTFRIAVLPAETTGKSSLDRSDMDSVLAYLGVAEKDITKVERN